MKRLVDTCRRLGYPVIFHDQYRDYYLDAPSYDPQFAVHEEDTALPPRQFPGSRFGDSKQGYIPFMRHWDGGTQAYLNARFMLGHLLKNYQLFFEHDIRTQGIYVDVINQSGGGSKAILVPLYNLVYHDAVIVSFGARDQKSLLQGLLFAGVPELPIIQSGIDEKSMALIRQMAALHKRVGLLEMTKHEFLDSNYRKERTTFADGTTVTVDWDANTAKIDPSLPEKL